MLLPCILIGRLNLKRSSSKEYGIIQVLEVEEDPGQVEQDLRIVWRHGQSSPEALNAGLGVTFDSPEVGYLVVNFNTLWFLTLGLLESPLYGININIGSFLGLLLEQVCNLGLWNVKVRSSVLDANKMIIVGEVDRLATVKNLIIKIIINQDSPIVADLLGVFYLTMIDAMETAVILISGLLPHSLSVGDGAQQDVHHHLLLDNVLPLVLAAHQVNGVAHHPAPIATREVHHMPGHPTVRGVAVQGAHQQEQETEPETRHFHVPQEYISVNFHGKSFQFVSSVL